MTKALSIIQKNFPEVKKVVDSKKGLTIEVTGRDVSSSKRKKHSECAMAVACKRALNLDGVIISMSKAYLIKDGTATRFDVPASIRTEVVSFDRGSGFETGEYELKKPHHDLKSFHIGGQRKTATGKGKAHSKKHVTKNVRAILGSAEY